MAHEAHWVTFMKKQQLEQSGIYSQRSLCIAGVALRPLMAAGVMQPLQSHHYSPRFPHYYFKGSWGASAPKAEVCWGWAGMRQLKLRIARGKKKKFSKTRFSSLSLQTKGKKQLLFFLKAQDLLWHLQSLQQRKKYCSVRDNHVWFSEETVQPWHLKVPAGIS